jgi:ring-1,2-phenylacetyl-CoA epoxidase subunit PaaC
MEDTQPVIELLYKMADDQLILAHRNSEWTGFGPLLEEDIAFSSMAQDKLGHAYALYQLLHTLGEAAPDTIAFTRAAMDFKNSIFVELPNGEYEVSLIRHFLFDTAEAIRFELLSSSSVEAIASLSKKIKGELRYHTLHANTWIKKLGNATPESIDRLQKALDMLLPFALGMFEKSPFEEQLIEKGIFVGEEKLCALWKSQLERILQATQLTLLPWKNVLPMNGGRMGTHSEYLKQLLAEMTEVISIDPKAMW